MHLMTLAKSKRLLPQRCQIRSLISRPSLYISEAQLAEVQASIDREDYFGARDKAVSIKEKANAISEQVNAAIEKVKGRR